MWPDETCHLDHIKMDPSKARSPRLKAQTKSAVVLLAASPRD